MEEIRDRMGRMSTREPVAKTFLEQVEEVPSTTFYFGLLGAILLSLWLFMSGRKWESLFVGLWAPTVMSFGLFTKLLRPIKREM